MCALTFVHFCFVIETLHIGRAASSRSAFDLLMLVGATSELQILQYDRGLQQQQQLVASPVCFVPGVYLGTARLALENVVCYKLLKAVSLSVVSGIMTSLPRPRLLVHCSLMISSFSFATDPDSSDRRHGNPKP